MNKLRDLIRSHPYLLIFSMIVLVVFWLPVFVVQDLPKRGWNIYLEKDYRGIFSDIVIDDQGRIWVSTCVPFPKRKVLYQFDNSKWTTLPGIYCDLARGPDGRIWAVSEEAKSVTVFDGEQRTTWTNKDLGIDPGDKIIRILIDQSGGLWITLYLKNADTSTSPAEHQLVRVILEDGKPPVLTRYPELLPFEGGFNSLYEDSQGRVWVGVWKNKNHKSDGLNMFDGKEWLPVQLPETGVDSIVQTAIDKEGRSWLITSCYALYIQTDIGWERVMEGSDCFFDSTNPVGITFDNHGRLWAWGNYMVRYLDGDQWITFDENNSGVGRFISNVVFDEQDRIWVASSYEVSMANLENLKPPPKILVDFIKFVEEHYVWGYGWFILTMLVLVWLAAYHEVLPGVLLAFGAGLAVSVMWHMFFGIFVSIGGAIGGFIGGRKDRRSGVPIDRWTNMNVILAIIGSVIGFGIGFLFAFLFIGN